MRIGLIWAQSANRVIGSNGTLPWSLPEDLKHFKSVTSGGTVIMGRRTWESLPAQRRPLPGRHNIVLTHQTAWQAPGAQVLGSVEAVLDVVLDLGPTGSWVIGGESVYQGFLPHAETLVTTEVDLVVDGDTYAPPIGTEWTPITPDPEWATSTTGLRYRTLTYARADHPGISAGI